MTGKESFLTELLNCGLYDLDLLDGVSYDWSEILAGEREVFTNMNEVMALVFQYGFEQMQQSISDRICEIEAIASERELDVGEESELHLLRYLKPEDDFDVYRNYQDTHVFCERHREVYALLCQDEVSEFEKGTGFAIEKLPLFIPYNEG